MQSKEISDTMDKEKDAIIAKTGSAVKPSDKTVKWASLKPEQKKKLMEAYYTKDELKKLTEKDLDEVAPDSFQKPSEKTSP